MTGTVNEPRCTVDFSEADEAKARATARRELRWIARMNVAGNPWDITLSEVAFAVSMGMLFCLWIFLVKGWLR
jgi:hypothetical protein